MHVLAMLLGSALILIVLADSFRTMVLPRRVQGRFRLTRIIYIAAWRPFLFVAKRITTKRTRESTLSVFGPASLFLLLVVWASALILGYGLFFYGLSSPFQSQHGGHGFFADLYVSGTTLFTLGLGDVLPVSRAARLLITIEAGMGFGFLAVVIGYLPVLYGAFSRREVEISLLDARAGSPPSAVEMLKRHNYPHGQEALAELLAHWERWSAELLESHISYPSLCFFRSQHDNQSWLAAIVAILDVSSLVLAGLEGQCARQAELTYAMSRHTLVDLAQIFHLSPCTDAAKARLCQGKYGDLCAELCRGGLVLSGTPEAEARLTEFRSLYEGYALALSDLLVMPIEGFLAVSSHKDNWRTVARIRGESIPASEVNPFLNVRGQEDEH